MNYFMMSLMCLMVYMMIYVLLDRICKCFEHCANAKYCAEYMSKSEVTAEINKKLQEK